MMLLFVLITFDMILGDFLRFFTNPEIQDGGPRWPLFINSGSRHHLMMRTSKATFSGVLSTLQVSLS